MSGAGGEEFADRRIALLGAPAPPVVPHPGRTGRPAPVILAPPRPPLPGRVLVGCERASGPRRLRCCALGPALIEPLVEIGTAYLICVGGK
jgi:hypothetical protein